MTKAGIDGSRPDPRRSLRVRTSQATIKTPATSSGRPTEKSARYRIESRLVHEPRYRRRVPPTSSPGKQPPKVGGARRFGDRERVHSIQRLATLMDFCSSGAATREPRSAR